MAGRSSEEVHVLTGQVRDACVRHLLQVFENAQISGLCCEGAFEVAVGQLRTVDAALLLEMARSNPESTA